MGELYSVSLEKSTLRGDLGAGCSFSMGSYKDDSGLWPTGSQQRLPLNLCARNESP